MVGSDVVATYGRSGYWTAILYVDGHPYCCSGPHAFADTANVAAQEMIDWYLSGGRL
jgi:hypothetical protein